jgi:hypothetical protein
LNCANGIAKFVHLLDSAFVPACVRPNLISQFCRKEGKMTVRKLGSFAALVFALLWAGDRLALAAPPPVTPNALTQPAGQSSVLIPINYAAGGAFALPNVIPDSTLASWATTALTVPDPLNANLRVSAVGGATFLFQTCFGGGFLDDLNNDLTPVGVPWVGGSAAQFDQPAYGQALGNPPANAPASSPIGNPPVNYWTNALVPTLKAGSVVSSDIATANANDPLGTPLNPAPAISETGQLYYANNGGTITLDNNNNINHYAILWAGYTDAQRHFTSIDSIYTSLTTAWKNTPYQIQILYGDGMSQVPGGPENNPAALPWGANANTTVTSATAATLSAAFTNVGALVTADFANNKANDQFFFYAGDHGGNNQALAGGVGGGGPAGTMTTTLPTLQISPGQYQGITNSPGAVPTLTFSYSMNDPTDDVEVLLDGNDIGDLTDNGSGTQTFVIPVSDIEPGTDTIDLDTVSGTPFTINNMDFFTGAIDDGPLEVPEPASAGLMALAAITALSRRRRTAAIRKAA